MKEEVRKALEILKDRSDTLVITIYSDNNQELKEELQHNQDAIATIERALNDTTLEIVKRKLKMVKEVTLTKTKFSERKWWLALQGSLEEIITEAEAGK